VKLVGKIDVQNRLERVELLDSASCRPTGDVITFATYNCCVSM